MQAAPSSWGQPPPSPSAQPSRRATPAHSRRRRDRRESDEDTYRTIQEMIEKLIQIARDPPPPARKNTKLLKALDRLYSIRSLDWHELERYSVAFEMGGKCFVWTDAVLSALRDALKGRVSDDQAGEICKLCDDILGIVWQEASCMAARVRLCGHGTADVSLANRFGTIKS
ncbi:hypothetical protein JCM3766R1_006070 [Sporobolomyces carnicolor]